MVHFIMRKKGTPFSNTLDESIGDKDNSFSLCLSPGTGFATCSIKESAADSDADLDVDGDDTLEYGKAQYTEADIIPCSGAGEDQGEAREREALRGAVLKYEALSRTPTQILYSAQWKEPLGYYAC